MLFNGKKAIHDIYHPSVDKMIRKMSKYFDKYENSEIYYDNGILAYKPTESNIRELERLANEKDPLALYETGINLVFGNFGINKDQKLGLERIKEAYQLGHKRALKYLIYHEIDAIKPEDLNIDLTNENTFAQLHRDNLHELFILEIYNNYDLQYEENLDVLIDAYKSGNFLGAQLYIEYLLNYYKYPIRAQQAYHDILKSYSFLDFSNFEWYSDIFNIDALENIPDGKTVKLDYLKDCLLRSLGTQNQYLWKYV